MPIVDKARFGEDGNFDWASVSLQIRRSSKPLASGSKSDYSHLKIAHRVNWRVKVVKQATVN